MSRNLPSRFRLYIDESGDHTFKHLHSEDRRYLGLLGVILPYSAEYTVFHDSMIALKEKHFVTHPDNPVILHRDDIIKRRKWFVVLRDEKKDSEFKADLLRFIQEQIYSVIIVVIDKYNHRRKYGDAAYHPYHYCLAVMLERYCGWLNATGRKGDVMAESRGGTEDNLLKKEYTSLYEDGTLFRKPPFFQQGFTSKELKLRKKEANIAGLQLADILAHPCKQDVLIEMELVKDRRSAFVQAICQCMNEDKYNRRIATGQVWGYGKKFID